MNKTLKRAAGALLAFILAFTMLAALPPLASAAPLDLIVGDNDSGNPYGSPTQAALQAAIDDIALNGGDGGTITLATNIPLNSAIEIPAGANVTFAPAASYSLHRAYGTNDGLYMLEVYGNLTITSNLTIDGLSYAASNALVYVGQTGTLTMGMGSTNYSDAISLNNNVATGAGQPGSIYVDGGVLTLGLVSLQTNSSAFGYEIYAKDAQLYFNNTVYITDQPDKSTLAILSNSILNLDVPGSFSNMMFALTNSSCVYMTPGSYITIASTDNLAAPIVKGTGGAALTQQDFYNSSVQVSMVGYAASLGADGFVYLTDKPSIVRVWPSDGATDVGVGEYLSIYFVSPTAEMTQATMGSVTINGTPVDLTDNAVSLYKFALSEYTLRISYPFSSSTNYTVVVSGFKDTLGNVVPDCTFSFTTRAAASAPFSLDIVNYSTLMDATVTHNAGAPQTVAAGNTLTLGGVNVTDTITLDLVGDGFILYFGLMNYNCQVASSTNTQIEFTAYNADTIYLVALPFNLTFTQTFSTFTGGTGTVSGVVNEDEALSYSLMIDGQGLEPGVDYTTASGSTVFTLSNGYLSALADGSYEVIAVFDTGAAKTTLVVDRPDTTTPVTPTPTPTTPTTPTTTATATTPSTGDPGGLLLHGGLLLLGFGLLAWVTAQKKKSGDAQ